MVDDYVDILESYLGVKRTIFSFVERWSQCPPEAAGGKPLKEFLSKVSFGKKSKFTHIQWIYRVDITPFSMKATTSMINFARIIARNSARSHTSAHT